MRQDGTGRSYLPVWSVAQTVVAVSDNAKGRIVAVGESTIDVEWPTYDGVADPVTYPKDALGIRKPFPWE